MFYSKHKNANKYMTNNEIVHDKFPLLKVTVNPSNRDSTRLNK